MFGAAMGAMGGGGGMPPISGGDATSGNGDSAFTNHTKFGGIDYNKGLPTWALAAGIAVVAIWVVSRAKS